MMARHAFVDIDAVMKKRADAFQPAAARLARRVAAVIGEDVTRETPVDTGQARSNWIMTIDEIATYVIPAYVPYIQTDHAGYANLRQSKHRQVLTGDKDESGNLTAVLAQHFVALQNFDPIRNKTIYLANNIPYIGMLNDGYSVQTPAGFVERAIDKGIKAARTMKLMEAA